MQVGECVHFGRHGLLCVGAMVVVCLREEHVEVGDDCAEMCCRGRVSCSVFDGGTERVLPSASSIVAAAMTRDDCGEQGCERKREMARVRSHWKVWRGCGLTRSLFHPPPRDARLPSHILHHRVAKTLQRLASRENESIAYKWPPVTLGPGLYVLPAGS